VAGKIRSIEKSSEIIGNGTRDLPACSIVSQSTTIQRAPRLELCGNKSVLKEHDVSETGSASSSGEKLRCNYTVQRTLLFLMDQREQVALKIFT
jgi:hypothetical protein